MTRFEGLAGPAAPDWEALVGVILHRGTPRRVHHLELFHDAEVTAAIAERFDLGTRVVPGDPQFDLARHVAVQRFLGFDYAVGRLVDIEVPFNWHEADDSAALKREGGRRFMDERAGPVTDRESLERFPWPDPHTPSATRHLEWLEANLPDDMCIMGVCGGSFCEYLTWLMGYETLCYALHDDRDLVGMIADRVRDYFRVCVERMLEFDRVRILFPSDDMGHKTGPLISPDDLREFVLPGHAMVARMAHEAGRPCILHSCGNLRDVLPDLIDDVGIDGKHSFEDTIEDVREAKHTYGRRIALLGGIDVDFLCRADERAIRRRVRETLDVCLPGGGYCLGTGNSVANYIPLDHYLAMVDEGRLYAS